MAYVLGYITADGCIAVTRGRKSPYALNITSKDVDHLYKIRNLLGSDHAISKKVDGHDLGYQLQIRNKTLTRDLINLGIHPRKTLTLEELAIPDQYFCDFARGFFDGDGTVYIYKVNGTPQIKAGFICSSLSFTKSFNKQLCRLLSIPLKSIHSRKEKDKLILYTINFYINDCEKMYSFFYQNSRIELSRKKTVFEDWTNNKRRGYHKQNYPSKMGWYLKPSLSKNLIAT